MNALLKYILIAAGAAGAATGALADSPKPVAPKPAAPRSVFVMPASPRDGRDPFYPESTRPYEDAVATQQTQQATTFIVKGLSVEHGRAMVIINNHTFAVGDEGDVLTTSGRVHIRLAAIKANAVVIESNGSRREIGIK